MQIQNVLYYVYFKIICQSTFSLINYISRLTVLSHVERLYHVIVAYRIKNEDWIKRQQFNYNSNLLILKSNQIGVSLMTAMF